MSYLPSVIAGVVAFVVTVMLGFWLIPLLRRLKFGQTILEIGPRWHKDKEGTPTMGGILFVFGILAASVAGFVLLQFNFSKHQVMGSRNETVVLSFGLLMALAFGVVGFLDDYIKVVRKQNEGLTEKQKLVFQFLIAILYIGGLALFGVSSTLVEIPFLGQFNLGIFYYPVMVLGVVYTINVVNFTDGVDGLCASVTLISAVGFIVISSLLQFYGMQMLSAALAGGCVGFLVWNLHPAKVFMGDTGSFFLGGMIVAIAFGLNLPVFIVLMGMVYALEGLSVLIQRYYFKYPRRKYGEGKRYFKMTPIHHHFELSGWSENKIVVIFSLVQAIFSAIAIGAVVYLL